MWLATWDILQSNDRLRIAELLPFLGELRLICSKVSMGGAFTSNNTSAEMAFQYVENTAKGICRCSLYPTQQILRPQKEEKLGFVKILQSEVFKELYEEHFWVRCESCQTKFNVREVIGGHTPWYDWKQV